MSATLVPPVTQEEFDAVVRLNDAIDRDDERMAHAALRHWRREADKWAVAFKSANLNLYVTLDPVAVAAAGRTVDSRPRERRSGRSRAGRAGPSDPSDPEPPGGRHSHVARFAALWIICTAIVDAVFMFGWPR